MLTIAPAIRVVVHAAGMGVNLITADLSQAYLLPPDVREWLPEDFDMTTDIRRGDAQW